MVHIRIRGIPILGRNLVDSAATPPELALVDVHGSYRAERLLHEKPDELISDLVTWSVLKPHLLRAIVIFVLVQVAQIPLFLIWAAVKASALNNSSGYGSYEDSGGSGGSAIFLVLLLLLWLGWLCSFFLPVRESIAEYGLVIEGKGGNGANAFGSLIETIERREAPFTWRMGKVLGVPCLRLLSGRVRALVFVRKIGNDLYVGWSMWRNRSTAVVVGNLVRDAVRRMSANTDEATDVRSTSARALRELVHSLTREGIQAALIERPVSLKTRGRIASLKPLGPVVDAIDASNF
jgi:hypothetical protein